MRLRLAPPGADLEPLQTMLLVAPVELPCLPEESGPLCDRVVAVNDLVTRFGADAGRTVAGLQLLCGGSFVNPRAGATQHCDRRVPEDLQVRAVAGHMHLLGRSISVTLDPGGPRERSLLKRPVWDFDDQGATVLKRPVQVRAGDTLRVTCTARRGAAQHDPRAGERAAPLRRVGRGHLGRDVPRHRDVHRHLSRAVGQVRACQAARSSCSRSGDSPGSSGWSTVRVQANVSRTVSASGRGDSPLA